MNLGQKLGRFLGHRWILSSSSLVIGLVSVYILWARLQDDYYDYLYFPKVKAADGYIYPQLRYTIFEILVIVCCINGLIFFVAGIRNALRSNGISQWTLRALLIYCGLVVAVFSVGIVMLIMRSHGI